MDNLLLPAEEENSSWRIQDYRWDPFRMEAEQLERRQLSSRRQSRGPVVCQVDGCCADLCGLKEYHQRYKICEYHLKVASIVKDGARQRFCQQCGRFHILSEFDGVKRSCRARLERHNARRRKKSEGSTSKTSRQSSVGQPRENKATPGPGDYEIDVDRKQTLGERGGRLSNEHRALAPHGDLPGAATKRPLLPPAHLSPSDQDVAMVSEGLRTPLEVYPMDLATGRVEAEVDPVAEVFQNFSHSSEARELWQAMAVSDVHAREGNQPPSAVAVSQVLLSPTERRTVPATLRPAPLQLNQETPGLVSCPAGRATSCPAPQYLGQWPLPATMPQELIGQEVATRPDQVTTSVNRGGPVPPEFMHQSECSVVYDSLLKLTSLSVKVFNCTPANLPPTLRQELLNAVQGGLVPEGYMRPGCVQLTLDAVQEKQGRHLSIKEVVNRLVTGEGAAFWKTHHLMVQHKDEVAIVRKGTVIQGFSQGEQPDLFPVLRRPRPLCILNKPGEKFSLQGKHISGLQDSILCRVQGHYVPIDIDYDAHEQLGDVEAVECVLLDNCPTGVVRVEAAHMGMVNSGPSVILTVKDPDVVAEICTLENEQLSDEFLNSLLHDMGRVLEFREWMQTKHGTCDTVVPRIVMSPRYSSEDMATIVHAARHLLPFACGRGWMAVTQAILPVARMGTCAVTKTMALVKRMPVDMVGLIHHTVDSEPSFMRCDAYNNCRRVQMHGEEAYSIGIQPKGCYRTWGLETRLRYSMFLKAREVLSATFCSTFSHSPPGRKMSLACEMAQLADHHKKRAFFCGLQRMLFKSGEQGCYATFVVSSIPMTIDCSTLLGSCEHVIESRKQDTPAVMELADMHDLSDCPHHSFDSIKNLDSHACYGRKEREGLLGSKLLTISHKQLTRDDFGFCGQSFYYPGDAVKRSPWTTFCIESIADKNNWKIKARLH